MTTGLLVPYIPVHIRYQEHLIVLMITNNILTPALKTQLTLSFKIGLKSTKMLLDASPEAQLY